MPQEATRAVGGEMPPVVDYGGGCGIGEDGEICDRTCVFSW